MIMDRHMYASLAFAVNDKWFSSLTPDQQRILKQAAKVEAMINRSISRAQENMLLERARKAKLDIYYPTSEEFNAFKDKTQMVVREYVEGIDGVGKAWVEKLLSAIDQAEKEMGYQ